MIVWIPTKHMITRIVYAFQLLAAGANTFLKNGDGYTVVQVARSNGHADIEAALHKHSMGTAQAPIYESIADSAPSPLATRKLPAPPIPTQKPVPVIISPHASPLVSRSTMSETVRAKPQPLRKAPPPPPQAGSNSTTSGMYGMRYCALSFGHFVLGSCM